MQTNDIIFEEFAGKEGNLGLITLNRQYALNALTHEMFNAFNHYLHVWHGLPSIKAVVIRAVEGRAFSAGGDVKSVYYNRQQGNEKLEDYFRDEYALNRLIYHYPKPYIALLDGITMGGGAGISLHGSHRIATERMTFAMPETTIGFFPDIGASYFLSRLPYKMGVYLGLSGESIAYNDAFELGLVDYVVPHHSQKSLIESLLRADLSSHQAVANVIKTFTIIPPSSNLLKQKDDIERCFSPKTVEKILEVLGITSDWSRSVAKTLMTKSPTSLKMTLEEITRAETLEFDACMDMEYGMMQRFLASHDFFEGVRALLIDKDKRPQWCPAQLSDITEKEVSQYFASSKSTVA